MVFAAGLGTRMRPLTASVPKPLVAVGGRTLLDHMLDRLAAAGVTRAIVNVHHLADQIEAHLARRTSPKIVISDERDRLLDQGGGIRRALSLLGTAPFLVCNTDAFWIGEPRSNLARLAAAWDAGRMDVLLLVADRKRSVGADGKGDFDMGDDGRLTRPREGAEARWIYSGVGILKPEFFAGPRDEAFRLAPLFFDAAGRGRLFGYALEGLWLHVGTPGAVAEAAAAMERAGP